VLTEALPAGHRAWRGIVHLWGLDSPSTTELTAESLMAAQVYGCGSIPSIVDALINTSSIDARICLVTRGAQSVAGQPAPHGLAQAPLWGLGRTLAEEHGEYWGGLVDLDPDADAPGAAAALARHLARPGKEDQIVMRGDDRFTPRLVRRDATANEPVRLRADATYLVTGGLGTLGLSTARWLAEQGARRLVLMGRTPMPERTTWSTAPADSSIGRRGTAIRELESMGVAVHLAPVDVADEAQLSTFLDTFRSEGWPAIRGVVHAAGAFDAGLLQRLDAAAFDTVLRPKLAGGWLLHTLLSDLEFFVGFSSIAALLPESGQASYAAANAFLDALAHHRRDRGNVALSMNWGHWAGSAVGGAEHWERIRQQTAEHGIGSFEPALGFAALGRMLANEATQALFAPVDWSVFNHTRGAGGAPRLLADLLVEGAHAATADHQQTPATLASQILAVEPGERLDLLHTYVRNQVATVLRMLPSTIDLDCPLGTLGMDSLMGIELRNRLEVDLGQKLPATLAWNYPTVTALAAYLGQRAGVPAGSPTPSDLNGTRRPGRIATGLAELSDDEALAALMSGQSRR